MAHNVYCMLTSFHVYSKSIYLLLQEIKVTPFGIKEEEGVTRPLDANRCSK